jgi:hypothetical protein
MSQFALLKRTAGTGAGVDVDGKGRGRLPLGMISSNRLVQNCDDVKSNPVRYSQPTVVRPFKHTEIPIGHRDDPQDAVEFEHIIYRTLRDREMLMRPLEFNQPEITLRDRNLLIDALDRFHYKLSLTTNALYRFIGILDRFLFVRALPKSKLRLFGCAALFIASKIEDICPAQANDLIDLADYTFTRDDLFAAEIEIINAIQFDTTFATGLFYLTHLTRIHNQTKESLLLTRYILELCQTHERLFGLPPALLASLSVMVTRILNQQEKWPKELADYSMHSIEELDRLVPIVYSMLIKPNREESRFIRRKYASDLFLRVALVDLPDRFS